MCPPVDVDEGELLRAAARERAVRGMSPGSRVRVVERVMHLPAKNGGDRTELEARTLRTLALWRRPSEAGPELAHRWRDSSRDPDYRRQLQAERVPNLEAGECCLVVAVLPAGLPGSSSRPWALLLSERSGIFGWCYALDGLELLSPAGGV